MFVGGPLFKAAGVAGRATERAILGGAEELAARGIGEVAAETAAKAREKALAFEQVAYRAKTLREVEAAKASRERMLDLAEQMEAKFGSRPDLSRKIQGPKTREAFRQGLFSNQ